jgi:maltose O-acetyltransferase
VIAVGLSREEVRHVAAWARARWQLRAADEIGARVRMYGSAKVTNEGRLVIGERVRLSSTIALTELSVAKGGLLDIGPRTFINHGCSIGATELVRIGARSSLGPFCMLMDNAFHRLEPDRRDETPPSAPVILEENVWLGARVIVLPGVTIGRDSVIAAGSVVTKDVPAGCVAGGVPARYLRELPRR